MADKLTKEQRHHCMAQIRGKGTKPEMVVRKFLFGRGFRYRLNHPWLPGHPDIVLRKYRSVIFVNGCFWHGHEGCRYYVVPKSNTEFWKTKIARNGQTDEAVVREFYLLLNQSLTKRASSDDGSTVIILHGTRKDFCR